MEQDGFVKLKVIIGVRLVLNNFSMVFFNKWQYYWKGLLFF